MLVQISPIVNFNLSSFPGLKNHYPKEDVLVDCSDKVRYPEVLRIKHLYVEAQKVALTAIKKIQGASFGIIPSNATIDHVETKDFLEKVIRVGLENDKDRIFELLQQKSEIRAEDLTSLVARVLQLALYDENPQRKVRIRTSRELRRELQEFRQYDHNNLGGLSIFLSGFLSRIGFKAKCFISESSHKSLAEKLQALEGVDFVQGGKLVSPQNVKFDDKAPGNFVCKTESIDFLKFFDDGDLEKIPPPRNGSKLSVDIIISSNEGIPTIDDCSEEFLKETSKDVSVYFLTAVNKAKSLEELQKFFDKIQNIDSRFSWAFSTFQNWAIFGEGIPRFRERIVTFSLNTSELLDIVRNFDIWFPCIPGKISNREEIKYKFQSLAECSEDIQSAKWIVRGVEALAELFGDQVNVVIRGHYLNLASYPSAARFTDEECDSLRAVSMFSRALAAQKVFFKDGIPKSYDELGVINFPFTVDAIDAFDGGIEEFGAHLGADLASSLRMNCWARHFDRVLVLVPTMPFLVRSGTAGAGDTMDLGRVLASEALIGDRIDARVL